MVQRNSDNNISSSSSGRSNNSDNKQPLPMICAKNPSKSQKCSKIRRRRRKITVNERTNERKCKKKSTLECGQFYLHCLLLCLITRFSFFFAFTDIFCPSRTFVQSQFIASTWTPHTEHQTSKKKEYKRLAIRLHFYLLFFLKNV